ncbi:MAG: 2-phospho-L-lactate transferase [Crenarchaeota archaeon]|nr:2-phospho-L-lactate transferase [Thermoproteota archaeon]
MITALAGGVGAARFLSGLVKIIDEKDLSVIVNTGDDMQLYGLHISPDVDIVSYTLAGIVNEAKGWGIKDDSFNFLSSLKGLGYETWFNLGDRDLATHMYRTLKLKQGLTLTQIAKEVSTSLGVKATILPMTNDPFETHITTKDGLMHFEEYFVKKGSADEVLKITFAGSENANPSEEVLGSIKNAETILICPSNPVVSIGTILCLKGVHDALKQTCARKIAISPIVAGAPIKGPADKMLRNLGLDVSAYSVAKLYADFLDVFIIDNADANQKQHIEQLGLEVKVTNTIMKTPEDKISLAKFALTA